MLTEQARKKIAITARAMLSGELGFIEGARMLSSLRFSADLADDSDLIAFVAIDSETDALPLGEARRRWQADVLVKLQPEIDRAEQWAREIGHVHCEQLVKRFGGSRASH